jgi:hypothetical protein
MSGKTEFMVKAHDGREYLVKADYWTESSNSVNFIIENEIVATFVGCLAFYRSDVVEAVS